MFHLCKLRKMLTKGLAVIIALVVLFAIVDFPVISVQAYEIFDALTSEPDEGNVFVGVKGLLSRSCQVFLDRINQIRFEACTAGNIPDPRDPSRMLNEEDYVPLKWSADLQTISRIRACESALTLCKNRVDGSEAGSFSLNGVTSTGEIYAGGGIYFSIETGFNTWCTGKTDWIEQNDGADTSDYVELIDPDNTYVGVSLFSITFRQAIIAEFSTSDEELDGTMTDGSEDYVIQKIEVPESSVTNIRFEYDDIEIRAGETLDTVINVDLQVVLSNNSVQPFKVEYIGEVSYESSDQEVASISESGTITANKGGTATISAYDEGELLDSINVIVIEITDDYYDSGTCGENLIWEFTGDRVLKISGTGDMYEYDWNIYPYDKYKEDVYSVVIDQGVTGIGKLAFSGFSMLSSVYLPDSLNTIGERAFINCSSLTDIYFDGTQDAWNAISVNISDQITDVAVHTEYNKVATGTCGTGLTWILNRAGELTISGIGDMDDYDSPSAEDNPAPWYAYAESIESVVIETGVTGIGEHAFANCINLTEVSIPASIEGIRNGAFESCSGLTDIYYDSTLKNWNLIPGHDSEELTNVQIHTNQTVNGTCGNNLIWEYVEDLTGVGTLTISGSGNMKNYNSYHIYGNGIVPWDAYKSDITSVIIMPGVTSIGNGAFGGFVNAVSVNLPDGITSVGDGAFYGCSSLENLIMPESLTTIAEGAFLNCSNLASINIPDSVVSIGNGAFCNCSSLEAIAIPGGVSGIGVSTFYGCESLGEVTISEGITTIGNGAFQYCSTIEEIIIPESVTLIGDYVFSNCSSLTNVSISEGVESIGEFAFCKCTDLISIDIPDSVTSIGQYAFYGCSGMETVTLSESLESIEPDVFSNCTNLAGIEIPDGVITIGDRAFYQCTGLDSVIIPDSVTSIGNAAFSLCSSITSLTIPGSITKLGNYEFSKCTGLTSIIIEYGVEEIGDSSFRQCTSLNEISLPASVTKLDQYAFSGCSALTDIVIPESVTSIGDFVFSGCSSLISLTIPEGVTSIGVSAFRGCSSLESITLPASLTSLTQTAFADCISLENISINENNDVYDSRDNCNAIIITETNELILGCNNSAIPYDVEIIGQNAFYGCSLLYEVVIPGSVVSIEQSAFSHCGNLKTVVIPLEVIRIGQGAFAGCLNITDVYYEGTAQEWNAIDIGSNNDYLTRSGILHYNQGAPVAELVCLGHSVTLNESISLNYYFIIPTYLHEDQNAYLYFKINDEFVSQLPVSSARLVNKDGIKGYMFSCYIDTKDMADTVEAVFVDSSGNESESFDYSVKQYCEELIQQSADDAKLVALVKSLMNYGASAQKYFGYNTDNLVNSSLSDSDKEISEIPAGSLDDYETTYHIDEAYADEILLYGYSLDLLSSLKIRLYFVFPTGGQIDDYTYQTVDYAGYSRYQDIDMGIGGLSVNIYGIYSFDIDEEYTVNIYKDGVQIGWVKTSPYAYVNSSIARNDLDENLRTLLYAMYYYNTCADAYFE